MKIGTGNQSFIAVGEAVKVASRTFGLSGMKRRELIALLGGAVIGWPLSVCAQHGGTPVVGFLHYASPNKLTHLADAFRRGLHEAGYIEGQNLVIEYRWAEGQYDRLPELAADLVRRQVGVIAAGGSVAAQAAKNATTTIPIVFTSGADPVATGLVTSLRRPGGNISGISLLAAELATKRIELMRDLLPRARAVAMITNPAFPGSHSEMAEVEAAGRSIGMRTHKVTASSPGDIDSAFATISHLSVDAFTVGADGFFITRREQFATLAAHYALPGIYPFPDFPEAGGLISYGLDLGDAYRQAGVHTARILNGAKPAELPVMQPTKFQLVINLKTVKELGLTVPHSILARADEVIE
jgi:putative ABC transport system substrate-binding protein